MCFTDNGGEANFSELRSFDQITQLNFHRWNLYEQNANYPGFSFSKYLPIGKTLGENERKNANCFVIYPSSWFWLCQFHTIPFLAGHHRSQVIIQILNSSLSFSLGNKSGLKKLSFARERCCFGAL